MFSTDIWWKTNSHCMNITTLNDYDLPSQYLEQLRSFLRISTTQDDEMLKMLFSSAVDYAQKMLKITIGKRDFCLKTLPNATIKLPENGVLTVTGVKISGVDAAFEQQNFCVKIPNGENMHGICEVFFTTDGGKCGDSLMIAIFSHVFFLYENRGIIQNGQKNGQASFESAEFQRLYAPFVENNFCI